MINLHKDEKNTESGWPSYQHWDFHIFDDWWKKIERIPVDEMYDKSDLLLVFYYKCLSVFGWYEPPSKYVYVDPDKLREKNKQFRKEALFIIATLIFLLWYFLCTLCGFLNKI